MNTELWAKEVGGIFYDIICENSLVDILLPTIMAAAV